MNDTILDYKRLVYSIAKKYSYNNDIEDLYQVGMIGLLKATENFNSEYNSKFSTYAHTYITGEILKYVRENKLIKVNRDLIKINNMMIKAKEVLSQKYLREATLEEIACFLELPIDTLIDAERANDYVKSLDFELNDEGKELNLYDSISYEENGYNENIIDLKNELSTLDTNEKKIINLRYYQDRSQQETSEAMGMSQVQVSRCEKKILTKLKTKLVA